VQPPSRPDRNIALEMIRVTEAAAIAAARWSGRGDKIAADGAAVDAMRFVLGAIAMDGIVVISTTASTSATAAPRRSTSPSTPSTAPR
jgi:fructose-1,6-bisphosphatase II